MTTLSQTRPPVKPYECRETLASVTVPYLEGQIEALTNRILAVLPQANVTFDDRAFILECLGEAHEGFCSDANPQEMVLSRAVALGGLDLCARILKM